MNPLAASLLLWVLLPTDDKPAPKLPLGKETTYITEPLDKGGYLDYEAALNDRFGKGITAEKNANVLFWKALGPRPEGGPGMPAEFFKRLGMEEPPANGDYFIDLGKYIQDRLNLAPSEFKSMVYDQQSEAMKRPWKATDYPHIALWLKANDKPLAVAFEASKRPDYFNPLVTDGKSGLIVAQLPAVQKCRGLAIALAARAMLRIEEGKFNDAWEDLLACHRLGRLVGRGATLIEGLVGIAINHIAANADLAYIEHAGLSAKQVQNRLKDLKSLPPMPPVADKIDQGERFMFLDSVQLVRRGGVGVLESLLGEAAPKRSDPDAEKAMAAIDWEPVLRNGNKWHDRMAAAMRMKDRDAREKELDKIDADLKGIKKRLDERRDDLRKLLSDENKPKETGELMSDILFGMLMPATRKIQSAYDRTEQVQRILQVAFALAAYRSEKGSYPDKLDNLAPKYMAAIPDDLFSGKALIYRPSKKGYLFYSVGVNGKDDEGRFKDDDPPGDDIGVRMPQPERKSTK